MSSSASQTRWRVAWLPILNLALTFLLFAMDTYLPRGTTWAFGYSAVVFLMVRSRGPGLAIAFTIGCSLLTWVALLVEPPGAALWMSVTDRFLVMVVIWLVAIVGLRRRQAEERLAATALELVRSNAELERFASVVAHDLRSPLMSLSGCAQLLEHALGDSLDTAAQESLGYIRNSISHMNRLIGSLLDYARIGKGELKLSDCDLGGLLASVRQNLSGLLTHAGATVTYDPMPVVRGDGLFLAQLFQNLIENAIKYRRDCPPRVHISAQTARAQWIFSVRDNGIGIDPRHTERVFEAFSRLHADESSHTGLGMGLATCKRIVERHGGRIWLESQPGHGTTVYLSLARLDAESKTYAPTDSPNAPISPTAPSARLRGLSSAKQRTVG
jgi:signal transduction histidine kinase